MAKKVTDKSVLVALKNIEKSMGNTKGRPVIFRFGDVEVEDIPAISFGIPEADTASNCLGLPRGKMVEIFGVESSGKSWLTLKAISEAQKEGLRCCLVDIEQSFDRKWAALNGVDVENLYLINDNMTAEMTLNYVVALCNSGVFGLVVIDSTAALTPKKELEGNIGDATVAELARIMSVACRKINNACGSTDTICVFVNQLREKIGVMFGDNTTTPGGRALKFYSDMRIKMTPGKVIRMNQGGVDKVIARKSYVRFVKNKCAAPFGECTVEIVFDENAFNPVMMLVYLARELKVIKPYKKELRIHSDDDKIGTGCYSLDTVAEYIVENDLVEHTLALVEEAIEFDPLDKDGNERVIDDAITEMKTDPTKIVSPNGVIPTIKAEVIVAPQEANNDEQENAK